MWSFQALTTEQGGTRLVTVTRVHCADRAALRGFTPYWLLIRPFGLIRPRLLAEVARRAEAAAAGAPRPPPGA